MNLSIRIPRSVLALLAILAVFTAGWGVAEATGGSGPSGNPAPTSPSKSVKAAPVAGQSEIYTGIKPCRILDTRQSSPMNDAARSFKASGTLSGQGGLNNCGIPTNATSIAINLTGISTGSTGFVRGWAYGGAQPTATLLNFGPEINVSNQVNIPLCKASCSGIAFTLRTWGSADLVGDAVGYYTAPMYGFVQESGNLLANHSSGIVSVTHPSTGVYLVTFDRDVTNCYVNASDDIWSVNRDASATAFNGTQVHVEVRDKDDAAVDTYFYVEAVC